MKRILRNAAAVIGDFKYGLIFHKGNGQTQLRHSLRMKHGVFQKIQQHLFD